jgi:predicted O-methyltransferase YrrM
MDSFPTSPGDELGSIGRGVMDLIRFFTQELTAPHYRASPLAALRLVYAKWCLRRSRIADPLEFLARMGVDVKIALCGFDRWQPVLEDALTRIQRAGEGQGGIDIKDGVILYGLARATQPEYVIETGVAAGISTSFLSAAMIENGHGQLFSIELPSTGGNEMAMVDGSHYNWQEHGVAWAIPEAIKAGLQGRHTLILKDVREALPQVLAQIPYVNLFFHDDLHTPDHMLWEYETIWPKLCPGGILLSDDANYGWVQFCRKRRFEREALGNVDRLCGVRKPGVGQREEAGDCMRLEGAVRSRN